MKPADARAPRRIALRRGHAAEAFAATWMRLKGYRILARRYAGGGGEIDLVASRGDVIAFVEVKRRDEFGTALDSIGPQKRRRFARAARHWLARNGWAASRTLRCDAVLVVPFALPRHLPDAFTLPD
jgi:putative endonuclease